MTDKDVNNSPKPMPRKPSKSIILLILGIFSILWAIIEGVIMLETNKLDPLTIPLLPDICLTLTAGFLAVVGFFSIIQLEFLLNFICSPKNFTAILIIEILGPIFMLYKNIGTCVLAIILNLFFVILIYALSLKQWGKMFLYEQELIKSLEDSESSDQSTQKTVDELESRENVIKEQQQVVEHLTETTHLDVQEGYKPAEVEGKFFVTKDGEEENLYCPKCYKKVSKSSSSCNECNRNFYKKFF